VELKPHVVIPVLPDSYINKQLEIVLVQKDNSIMDQNVKIVALNVPPVKQLLAIV